jgi:hypothetical protein
MNTVKNTAAKETAIAVMVAWAREHGCTPEIRVTHTDHVEGSRLSSDERGRRSTGYRRVWVRAVTPEAQTIAEYDAGEVDFEFLMPSAREAADAAEACWAACWAAIETGPLPAVETTVTLAEERDLVPSKSGPQNTTRARIVLVSGPQGRWVEVQWTYPLAKVERMRGEVFRCRVLAARILPSKAMPGAWLVSCALLKRAVARITDAEHDAILAALRVP